MQFNFLQLLTILIFFLLTTVVTEVQRRKNYNILNNQPSESRDHDHSANKAWISAHI